MPYALRLLHWVAALVCLGLVAGCAQLETKPSITRVLSFSDKPQIPTSLVAIWTDAAAQHPDRPPTRGFGGRLMFYGPKSDRPVRVDGSLVVYAYDEQTGDLRSAEPDRKYVFTAEQFAKHHSESELGHSYSVWIPWDEAGGPQKRIGLICRFNPVEGPALVSEQTVVTLPGKPMPVAASKVERAGYVEQVGSKRTAVASATHRAAGQEVEPNDEQGGKQARMQISTIPISPHFGRLRPVAQSRTQAGAAGTQKTATRRSAPAPGPPSTDCPPGELQVPTVPRARPASDRAPWQPRPGESPSPLQSRP